MSLAERESMKEAIGFNLVSFVIAFICIMVSDVDLKEKIIGMIIEVVLMAILSIGVILMVGI